MRGQQGALERNSGRGGQSLQGGGKLGADVERASLLPRIFTPGRHAAARELQHAAVGEFLLPKPTTTFGRERLAFKRNEVPESRTRGGLDGRGRFADEGEVRPEQLGHHG